MQLNSIREQRAAKVGEMRAVIAKAEAEKRSLSADEQSKFDALKGEVQTLEADEQRAAFLQEAERRMTGEPVGDKSFDTLQRQVNVVDVIRAQMEGRALSGAAAEYTKETERRTGRKAQGAFVPMAALEQRVSTTTSAAEIVPTVHRPDQFIEPFRNSLLARRLGVRVLTGLTGNLSIPKYGTGLTTGWVAQNSALTPSDMTFDSVTLSPKHAGGITELSRQLIQQSSPDVEQLVRDDLAYMLAKAIDSALIKGGGTNEPVGILSAANTQTGTLATLSYAAVLAMIEKLELSNVASAAWLTSPQAKTKFASQLTSDGLPGWMLENGRVADYPFFSTNQVPTTGESPDTANVILGDFSQVLLGIWSELDLLVNPFSETAYSKGNVMVRAMSTVDIAMRHPEAFVIADDLAI